MESRGRPAKPGGELGIRVIVSFRDVPTDASLLEYGVGRSIRKLETASARPERSTEECSTSTVETSQRTMSECRCLIDPVHQAASNCIQGYSADMHLKNAASIPFSGE